MILDLASCKGGPALSFLGWGAFTAGRATLSRVELVTYDMDRYWTETGFSLSILRCAFWGLNGCANSFLVADVLPFVI